ncbi:MAG: hypothetical protein GF418_06205 [Chitinivibrionales bacterium]|nr:hypothetical protein [Chitinivibrionales bacterium]MBD3395204.1 hypothetical protein [Chitinivibrionales bacterium]
MRAIGLSLLCLCIGAACISRCSILKEQNHVFILDAEPHDSSTVTIFDTITVTLDYEFGSKYRDAGVILAMDMLCDKDYTGGELVFDTLTSASAVIDVRFTLAEFDSLCRFENTPDFHAFRFKLVLDRSGELDRVVRSGLLYYYHTNPI